MKRKYIICFLLTIKIQTNNQNEIVYKKNKSSNRLLSDFRPRDSGIIWSCTHLGGELSHCTERAIQPSLVMCLSTKQKLVYALRDICLYKLALHTQSFPLSFLENRSMVSIHTEWIFMKFLFKSVLNSLNEIRYTNSAAG